VLLIIDLHFSLF